VADLISVVVTTFDRVDALDAVLRSLAAQTDRDFEVVVADDGSGPETAALIESWKSRIGVPLLHVWHRHEGFRAAEIRNRAIQLSRGAYVIFLDGDCLTRPDFIARHRKLAERGWFVAGNRVLLTAMFTKRALREGVTPEMWRLSQWMSPWLGARMNRLAPLVRLPLGPLRKVRARAWKGARSCNLAVWRADLDRVDGFDADYRGWGREDSDLVVRLLRAGVLRKDGSFATGVLHLHHAEFDRAALPDNDARLGTRLREDAVRARSGLSALRPREPQASAR